ncbi:unnamed protein product [Caenorhabditis brenneri]
MSTIECGICFLQYNEEARIPRILTNCGHTICQECATKLSTDGRMIACPFDRNVTVLLGYGGVPGLQKNFALLDLARRANQEQDKNSGKKADVPCFENPSHEAVVYCQQCEVDFCDRCFTTVHKSKALSAHQKVEISEKPIKLPKCPRHPHNVAEFLCTDPNCKIPTKIMCQTCVLFDQHKSHKYGFLMEKLLENEQFLKVVLERYEKNQLQGGTIIERVKKNLESFDVSGADFKNVAQKISDEFDMRKKEALRKLTVFVNDAKKKQTELKKRLENEYCKSEEFRKQIERKLKMKNDLQNTDEIMSLENSRRPWNVSLTDLESLRDKKFIVF